MYTIHYSRQAIKDLKKLGKSKRDTIRGKIKPILTSERAEELETLTSTLFPLKSYKFSLEDGEYRVTYLLHRDQKIVLITSIGTRENFYKLLRRRMPRGGWTTLLDELLGDDGE